MPPAVRHTFDDGSTYLTYPVKVDLFGFSFYFSHVQFYFLLEFGCRVWRKRIDAAIDFVLFKSDRG